MRIVSGVLLAMLAVTVLRRCFAAVLDPSPERVQMAVKHSILSLIWFDAAIVAATSDDPAAAATLDRYVDRLARALATVINLFDPEVVVLGGGLSGVPLLYDAVPRRWGRYVFSDQVLTRLVPPRFGDASGVRGAAWLWPDPPG